MMAMGHVGGMAFELEEPEMRNARLRNLNTLFRNIADDNVNVCTHLIRHPDVPELPQAAFRSGFAAGLDRTYRDRVLNGRLFRNDYFFSLIVTPRNLLGKAGSKIARFRKGPASDGDAGVLRTLEDCGTFWRTAWKPMVSAVSASARKTRWYSPGTNRLTRPAMTRPMRPMIRNEPIGERTRFVV